jgi:hypothetical protein
VLLTHSEAMTGRMEYRPQQGLQPVSQGDPEHFLLPGSLASPGSPLRDQPCFLPGRQLLPLRCLPRGDRAGETEARQGKEVSYGCY